LFVERISVDPCSQRLPRRRVETNRPSLRVAVNMFHGGRRGHARRIHAARAIPSIRDGMDVVRTAASVPGPMIDSGHFCFSDNTWQDLAVVPLDEIALSAIRRWVGT
jgi:hypothetical protein